MSKLYASLAGLILGVALASPAIAQTPPEDDVEGFSAERMTSTYLQGRGGENVKFPDDPKFKTVLDQTITLEGYNSWFSGKDKLKAHGPKIFEKVPTSQNTIYLTFDDGPYVTGDGAQATTDELLQIMSKKGATGTFFFQGIWSWKNKDVLRKVVKNNSNIGNHTAHHPPDGDFMGPIKLPEKVRFASLKPDWQAREVLWGRAGMLYALDGQSSSLTPYFRSPHGSGVVAYPTRPASPEAIKQVCAQGHVIINGNLLLSDARGDLSKAALLKTYKNYFKPGKPGQYKGEILWLHSGLKATVEALPDIIDLLQNQGYAVRALPSGLSEMAGVENSPGYMAPMTNPWSILAQYLQVPIPWISSVEPESDYCPCATFH